MNLYSYFLNNRDRPIIKNVHYFPIYERYFQRYINRPVFMLEIGTGQGGSARMWKQYFGPLARIVTVDIRNCKQFAESQIYVRTGSQSDAGFLRDIVAEFGAPDIVLDDGSHRMQDVNASFDILFPALRSDGIYFVEDLRSAYSPKLGGGLRAPGSFIERCKNLVDTMNVGTPKGTELNPAKGAADQAFSISFFQSVVVIEKVPYVNNEMLSLPKRPPVAQGAKRPPVQPQPVKVVDL
jgi:hypothetical protein